MAEVEDWQLIRDFQAGKNEAFAVILKRYERPIFNLVYGMVNHYEDARDLSQQIFAKAARKIGQFDPSHRLFSWLYRIAINETLNFLERTQRFEGVEDRQFAGPEDPEKQYMRHEFEVHLRNALSRLAPQYRALILLKHFEGCSYREISSVLGIPESTVKSRLFTGRRYLWEDLHRKGLLQRHGPATH